MYASLRQFVAAALFSADSFSAAAIGNLIGKSFKQEFTHVYRNREHTVTVAIWSFDRVILPKLIKTLYYVSTHVHVCEALGSSSSCSKSCTVHGIPY